MSEAVVDGSMLGEVVAGRKRLGPVVVVRHRGSADGGDWRCDEGCGLGG